MNVLVAGAGGFIGGHLVRRLLNEGHEVRAVDRKVGGWWQVHPDADNRGGTQGDMRNSAQARNAMVGVAQVYDLAADMGGIGHIESHRADCAFSVRIATELLQAAIHAGISRFFFASSACVYAAEKQLSPAVIALREEDAWPAQPEAGYGLEKLFTEELCRYVTEDYGLETRVARYHNVYGPNGTWDGGREKAPAAICRKVAEAARSGHHEIEIWGDGEQTRSFMWVDDCVEGTRRLMDSDVAEPLNIGSAELVTVNQLVDAVELIAGVRLTRAYKLDAPQGVRGRNSDNTMIRDRLDGWEPSTALLQGLGVLYPWVYDQLVR